MKTEIARILISDDNLIVRTGLRSLLQNVLNFSIAGEASNGQGIITLLQEGIKADVLLMEIDAFPADSEKLITTVKTSYPQLKIVVLSSENNQKHVSKAFKAGVDGYLLKSVESDELVFALKHVCNNATYICSQLMNHFLSRLAELPDVIITSDASLPNFTGREIQILTLISQGYTNMQISEMLFTSRRTVENYRQGLIDKTGSRNIVSLVRFAILNGLIS